ncbi:uncharacterized protein [Macrobrachium rosenbergii]|uniref:uncharacterized protein n=1 Tax=Macrobrachium rosenbergii TaxID=79674 RepID=UPI0034D67579
MAAENYKAFRELGTAAGLTGLDLATWVKEQMDDLAKREKEDSNSGIMKPNRGCMKLNRGAMKKNGGVLDGANNVIALLLTRIELLASVLQQWARLLKLKELPLPVFNGEINEYATFKELFDVHVNRCNDLDSITKFTYLLGALKKEPLSVVKALSVTAANYDVALGLLERYYGN